MGPLGGDEVLQREALKNGILPFKRGPREIPPLSLLPCIMVQLQSRVRLSVTPWTAAHQAPLSFSISRSVLKLMSVVLIPSTL